MTAKIRVSFDFDPRLVSCGSCLCNYSNYLTDSPLAEAGKWCQVWSQPIDPLDSDSCEARASKCTEWVPRKTRRDCIQNVAATNPERWYEKDSMG